MVAEVQACLVASYLVANQMEEVVVQDEKVSVDLALVHDQILVQIGDRDHQDLDHLARVPFQVRDDDVVVVAVASVVIVEVQMINFVLGLEVVVGVAAMGDLASVVSLMTVMMEVAEVELVTLKIKRCISTHVHVSNIY